METELTLPSLAKRVEILEQRLGIDPLAVVAGEAASAAAGADAHVANVQSDVPAPVVPQSAESALELAIEKLDAGDAPGALDVLNTAVQSWPDDSSLTAAQADVQKTVDEQAAEAAAKVEQKS